MKDRLIILIMFAAAIFGLPFLTGQGVRAMDEPPARTEFPESVAVYLTDTGEIVTVGAEEYIEGCLAAQMPIDYEPEALKAQAAASATYALRLMRELPGSGKLPEGADISDDPRLGQPYLTPERRESEYGSDYAKYADRLAEAARFGKTNILTYKGEPIYAVYHAVSAGRTCPSEYVWGVELDYLRRSDSLADRGYINFECSNEMRAEDARLALAYYDPDIKIPADCAKWFSDMNVNEEGYVISSRIGENVFSGGDLWRIFGLRSTAFTVTYADGIFTFTTKGLGHGAGLSQYGANEMAKSGTPAEQILAHYYPGAQ
ncbi:MAG: SpoIID/LytB domain-containing protein [Ruminiclostridium sp.]|nr:SpoIID/LytB domain-containing protein [Ruminiclostridium sp.]